MFSKKIMAIFYLILSYFISIGGILIIGPFALLQTTSTQSFGFLKSSISLFISLILYIKHSSWLFISITVSITASALIICL